MGYKQDMKKRIGIRRHALRKIRLQRMHSNQKGKCYYCNEDTWLLKNGKKIWHEDVESEHLHTTKETRATVEHLIPQVKGGGHYTRNLTMACSKCNNQRGSYYTPEEWVEIVNNKSARQAYIEERVAKNKRKNEIGKERTLAFLIILGYLMFIPSFNEQVKKLIGEN